MSFRTRRASQALAQAVACSGFVDYSWAELPLNREGVMWRIVPKANLPGGDDQAFVSVIGAYLKRDDLAGDANLTAEDAHEATEQLGHELRHLAASGSLEAVRAVLGAIPEMWIEVNCLLVPVDGDRKTELCGMLIIDALDGAVKVMSTTTA